MLSKLDHHDNARDKESPGLVPGGSASGARKAVRGRPFHSHKSIAIGKLMAKPVIVDRAVTNRPAGAVRFQDRVSMQRLVRTKFSFEAVLANSMPADDCQVAEKPARPGVDIDAVFAEGDDTDLGYRDLLDEMPTVEVDALVAGDELARLLTSDESDEPAVE